MLNLAKQGTFQDSTGNQWVFYQDDVTPSVFYVVPRPQYIVDDHGNPVLQFITYATNSPSTNGSGYVQIGVELSVPQAILQGIAGAIQQQFGESSPTFNALQYDPSGMVYLTVNDNGQSRVYSAPASAFGSNQATFVVELDPAGMKSAAAALTTRGGAFPLQYALTVPARLPAVSAVLSYDSSIAYQYQVTQPQHHTWGSDTPGSVQAFLQASGASNTTINWGTSNPPASLQQEVATWANTTLGDMVNAEVQKQMQIQGMTSSQTFDINTTNSFTNTYQQNEVIAWTIQPQAVLPSLTDLGLTLAPFSSTVNDQLQVMTVITSLPFQSEVSASSPLAAVSVLHATVTATYPGLPEAQATATFTTNGYHTFTAPFDPAQGPAWSLSWDVTYVGGTQVSGSADTDQGQYTLSLPEVGILTVTFDASPVFQSTDDNAPTSVTIDLSFMEPSGAGQFINEQKTVDATNPVATITSLNAVPITTTYNYTVTYNFATGLTYRAPTKSNQNGFTQRIPFSSAVQGTPVFLIYPNNSPDPLLGANVKMWYQNDPAVQGVTNAPTATSPAEFFLLPLPSGSVTFARLMFEALVNTTSPLVYTASINTVGPQIVISEQVIESDFPALQISPTQRYFTLTIDPTTIDWRKSKSVQVEVTPAVAGAVQPTLLFTFHSGDTSPQYLTVPLLTSQSVSYTWKASYINPGQTPGQTTGSGSASDVILDVPPNA